VTFEFDKNGSLLNPSRIPISITTGMPAAAMATAIANAINSVTSGLEMTATTSSYDVVLVHDLAGSFGNRAISGTVITSLFTVSGMGGGAGYDCPSGTRCTRNEDCDLSMVCQPDGTCGVL